MRVSLIRGPLWASLQICFVALTNTRLHFVETPNTDRNDSCRDSHKGASNNQGHLILTQNSEAFIVSTPFTFSQEPSAAKAHLEANRRNDLSRYYKPSRATPTLPVDSYHTLFKGTQLCGGSDQSRAPHAYR